MAKNLKFFFDKQGVPCARGPQSERVLMAFLETDVQGDDHICHDLMEDITAIEEDAVDSREFSGRAHVVTIEKDGIKIAPLGSQSPGLSPDETPDETPGSGQGNNSEDASSERYETGLKHFREILEDWEAFILDEQEL